MCKIKSGELLNSIQDIQNLIIGILFRQENEYNINQIYDCVNSYCNMSVYKITKDELMKLIDKNLDFLSRIGTIQCKNGQYVPMSSYDYVINI